MIAEILSSRGSSSKEFVKKKKTEKLGRLIRLVFCELLLDSFVFKSVKMAISFIVCFFSNDEPDIFLIQPITAMNFELNPSMRMFLFSGGSFNKESLKKK